MNSLIIYIIGPDGAPALIKLNIMLTVPTTDIMLLILSMLSPTEPADSTVLAGGGGVPEIFIVALDLMKES